MQEIKNAISKDELIEDLHKFREILRGQLAAETPFSYNHGHIAGELSDVSRVIDMLTKWGEKERNLF
ncbi:hypothetical protein SAMN05216238_103138 [Lentibacillus persicus]|uniref:Uncharacterized protein n=1 Tax=Lentibacillus persicus TaxID=640948 RepID=A0A1I1UHV5_9BACI|nr:hypothetical protein [Lentibacillus persicus]SFD68343.1 hypothetical protein SAMN05216238_103138 [Lentibacillus persicus]